MAKKTISATIDKRLVKQLDGVAKDHNVSRSRMLETCIEAWLNQESLVQLKEGYLAQAETMKDISEITWNAQREILTTESW